MTQICRKQVVNKIQPQYYLCFYKKCSNMKNTELAKKIKELRGRKGMSQEELAEKSQLSLRTVQRIEGGETEPRGDTLHRPSSRLLPVTIKNGCLFISFFIYWYIFS